MNEQKYAIHWKNRKTGEESHGAAVYTQSEAIAEVRVLNKEFPEFEHWYQAESASVTWSIADALEREG